jgi:hypothetical protein
VNGDRRASSVQVQVHVPPATRALVAYTARWFAAAALFAILAVLILG